MVYSSQILIIILDENIRHYRNPHLPKMLQGRLESKLYQIE